MCVVFYECRDACNLKACDDSENPNKFIHRKGAMEKESDYTKFFRYLNPVKRFFRCS